MRQEINIENWNRKELFYLFKKYGDPFCGVTVNIDITNVYNEAKQDGASFYYYYLHLLMRAVNSYEPIRLRLEGEKVYLYDQVGIAPTVGREDGTIGFAYFPYIEDRKEFIKECGRITEDIKSRTGLCTEDHPAESRSAIFFSAVPWLQFTDMKNPLSFHPDDCNPRISTGRVFEENGRRLMPFAIQVHHSLMDGFHIAQFIEYFKKLLS